MKSSQNHMNILVFVPTAREAAHISLQSGSFAGQSAGVGHNVSLHICGVGMAECAAETAHVLANSRPDLAILVGIAGASGGELSVGDTVVVATEVIADQGRLTADGKFTPLFQETYPATVAAPPGFRIARGLSVATAGWTDRYSPESTDSLYAVENMEGAAFFAVCARFGVPAMELRTVSNRVGEPITPADLELSVRRLADDLYRLLACKSVAGKGETKVQPAAWDGDGLPTLQMQSR
jgi:nucleoside phosphorylase